MKLLVIILVGLMWVTGCVMVVGGDNNRIHSDPDRNLNIDRDVKVIK